MPDISVINGAMRYDHCTLLYNPRAMQILRGLYSPDQQPVALTIGNFDGVHLGHQALLNTLSAAAKTRGLQTAVMIFEPHPREFFTPKQAPARLTSLREKLELFSAEGIDRVYVCRFNAHFAAMSAEDFINTLHEKVHAGYVLIGDDFRFGSGRTGDFALMEKIGSRHGFNVQADNWARRGPIWGGITASADGWFMATGWGKKSGFQPRISS